MARVWPNMIVDEGNLKVNMAALRRTLGDGGPGDARYIATVTGRGYRFVAPVLASVLSDIALASCSGDDAPPQLADWNDAHRRKGGCDRRHSARSRRVAARVDCRRRRHRQRRRSRSPSPNTRSGSFRDGVWLVDLALLKDPALVPNAIATAIGLAAHSANTLAALCEFLRDREMLLVLDSCEHIIDAAAVLRRSDPGGCCRREDPRHQPRAASSERRTRPQAAGAGRAAALVST